MGKFKKIKTVTCSSINQVNMSYLFLLQAHFRSLWSLSKPKPLRVLLEERPSPQLAEGDVLIDFGAVVPLLLGHVTPLLPAA